MVVCSLHIRPQTPVEGNRVPVLEEAELQEAQEQGRGSVVPVREGEEDLVVGRAEDACGWARLLLPAPRYSLPC